MRGTRRFVIASSVAIGALAAAVATPRVANAQEEGESYAMEANRGLKLGIAPALLFPLRDNGPYGGGLTFDARYGIRVGPTVLAPGGRLAAYGISERFVGLAMPTFRVSVPVGPIAPFLVGGIGAGYISNESDAGLALQGGGGLMFHLGRIFGFGAEATYQVITGTAMKTWVIGPSMSIGG